MKNLHLKNSIYNLRAVTLLLFLNILLHLPSSLSAQCNCTQGEVGTGVGIPSLTQSSISTATPYTGCIRVNGKFSINTNWTISGADVIMLPGAEIEVASGVTLTVNSNAQLRAAARCGRA